MDVWHNILTATSRPHCAWNAGNATFPNPADNPRVERITVLPATPGVVLSAGTDVVVTVTWFCSPGPAYYTYPDGSSYQMGQILYVFAAIIPEQTYRPDPYPITPWKLVYSYTCFGYGETQTTTFTVMLPESPAIGFNRNGLVPVAAVRAVTTYDWGALDYSDKLATVACPTEGPVVGPSSEVWRDVDDLTFAIAPSGGLDDAGRPACGVHGHLSDEALALRPCGTEQGIDAPSRRRQLLDQLCGTSTPTSPHPHPHPHPVATGHSDCCPDHRRTTRTGTDGPLPPARGVVTGCLAANKPQAAGKPQAGAQPNFNPVRDGLLLVGGALFWSHSVNYTTTCVTDPASDAGSVVLAL